ncbi:MAG: AMP-binding protein [Fusobacteriaceae bacterium]
MNFLYNRDKIAVIYNDIEYSYKELINASKYYGSLLNISKDDRVVIFIENRPEFIYSIFGIWDKKGISVTLDATSDAEQIAYVLKDATPTHIITSQLNYDVALAAKKLSGSKIKIINVDNETIPKNFVSANSVIEGLEQEKTIAILYTSGTTGLPKGVMISFKNIMANLLALREINLVSEKDRVLGMLPFHHVLPLVGTIMLPLYFGGTLIILKELSSEAIKSTLAKYKITFVIGVPRVWEMFHKGIMGKINSSKLVERLFKICEKINNKNLNKIVFKKVQEAFGGNINILVSGGAKLDSQITKDFTTLGFTMMEGYGLTETSPIVSFNRVGSIKAGTVGTPIPRVEIKIADDGELLVRGENVMQGYYNNPKATSDVIDKEGWFYTGDLATYDGQYITITGRKKEMIVLSNGKNINPVDIEIELMRGSDLIKEVAVVEHNNHLLGLIYPDFDLAKERGVVNIKEELKWQIIDKYNVTAPKYRKILETKIVSLELPKTKLGKLQRFKLAELIGVIKPEEKRKEEKTLKSDYIETKEYIKLREYLKKIHTEANINPDSHMEIDIGMDSLDNVELLSYIEATFSVKMSEEDLSRIKRVREIADFIKEKGGEFKEGDIDWKKILDSPTNHPMPNSNCVGKILNLLFIKPFFSLYIKLNKTGEEKIPNESVIFVGNHQSMLDGFAFSQILSSKIKHKTYYLGISDHFNSKIKSYIANNSNIILVDMNKSIKETLKVIAKALNSGHNVVIFPEGARTRDGELQEFKKTFAIIAKELNIPVTVFGIKGAYSLMPFGKTKPSRGEMSVEILETIYPQKLTVEEIVKRSKNKIVEYLK